MTEFLTDSGEDLRAEIFSEGPWKRKDYKYPGQIRNGKYFQNLI